MNLDLVIFSAEVIAYLALLAVLVAMRVFRDLPIFVAYIAYELIVLAVEIVFIHSSQESRILPWIIGTTIETTLYFLVLRELGKSVLRYNRGVSPSRVLASLLFVVAVLLIGFAVQWRSFPHYPFAWRALLRLFQTATILQTAAFGAIVMWSHLMKLRWPNREFRIVGGMGAWTLISLGALMLHIDGFNGGPQNHWVDLLNPVACLCVSVWWLHYFWFEPAPAQPARADPAHQGVARSRES